MIAEKILNRTSYHQLSRFLFISPEYGGEAGEKRISGGVLLFELHRPSGSLRLCGETPRAGALG
jgi:hypothetical protein